MATYAIGDLQGCYAALQNLLNKLNFNPEYDKLWFVGDLVNRGSDSLATLRFVKSLGNSAVTVLGNHDLHLLAVAHGIKTTRSKDLQRILDASDSSELLLWLSQRPLLHHDSLSGYTMVHAGIYPSWSLAQAKEYAAELENSLQNNLVDFLSHMYGDKPDKWDNHLQGFERLRFICNSFTRMRFVDEDGYLDHDNKMQPETATGTSRPWFEFIKNSDTKIIFGHWSTLPLITGPIVYAIDTGCVWGGSLSALCLETEEIIQVACQQESDPEKFI